MVRYREMIDISDDEDEDMPKILDDYSGYGRSGREDDDTGWDTEDEDLQAAIKQSLLDAKKQTRTTPTRNAPIRLPFQEDAYAKTQDGLIVRHGDSVELERGEDEMQGLQSGDFLRVRHIIRNLETDEVVLRGLRFRRAKYMGRTYEKKLNELVLILRIDENDGRPAFEQAMEDIKLEDLVRKRDLVITNADYPHGSFRQTQVVCKSTIRRDIMRHIHDNERLVCRHVQVVSWGNEALRKSRKSYAGEERRVYPHEADYAFEDRSAPTGGEGSEENPFCLDVEDPEKKANATLTPSERARKRVLSLKINEPPGTVKRLRVAFARKKLRYRFADCFHGAGGASRGAQMANMEIYCGFDNNKLACEAYGENFPGCLSFQMNAADFPPTGFNVLKPEIDHMHFSPPCQAFSPAHTHMGPNDEANIDALFTIGPLLKRCNPRIATLEQTAGLITHHEGYLQLLFNQFVNAGYNLRWRREFLQNFGVPQRRTRLILIAAR
ncbi:S-adenosyl-L-methionine-dependent methyltransferase [Mytilinidion resinicola]|uniref:DNA (cytosine-5-)-methyltransferase n=1 Tax=Mytilinidion resinicola TaxID=574789 RepID=A0A6A6YPV5_9PEZI|nr:S-adenosyl-L-methionine-dependent methyltransferase [Mytilinidion resinicola]KAF2810558.1 S-adenosyl-L-methionine-dependent methyltransferase [Mytilinidion resinicola]